MFPTQMCLGLPKPEGNDDIPPSLNEMRAAITRGQRDSALIRSCFMGAEVQGLSGEDKYVLLAYHALRVLEDTHQRLSRFIELSPMPPMIIPLQQAIDAGLFPGNKE